MNDADNQDKLDELDQKLKEIDNPDNRVEAAKVYYEKARILLQLSQDIDDEEEEEDLRKQTALNLYHAALRFKMASELNLLVEIISMINTNDLEKEHPKLKTLYNTLAQIPDLKQISGEESIEDIGKRPSEKVDNIQVVIERAKKKVQKISQDEENKFLTRSDVIFSFNKILTNLLDTRKNLNLEDPEIKNFNHLCKELVTSSLLRCLMTQNIKSARIVLNLVDTHSLQIDSPYIARIKKLENIIEQFKNGEKIVFWLPKSELRNENLPIEDQVSLVMNQGYMLDIEEDVELEIQVLYNLDLLMGLRSIPTQDFDDVPRTTPSAIILNLYDKYPSNLIVIEYQMANVPGLMIVPTGDVKPVQVINLAKKV